MLHAEFENFLVDENLRCNQLKSILAVAQNETQQENKKWKRRNVADLKAWYEEYCESCRQEMDMLEDQGSALKFSP